MQQKIHSRSFRIERTAPGEARRWLNEVLKHLDEDKRRDAALLLSELVTNAVLHSGLGPEDDTLVQVFDDGTKVYVEVCDDGRRFDFRYAPREVSENGGHGLSIVQRLADRAGAHSNGINRVWFELHR